MKKFAFIVGVILIPAVLVAAGWYFGYHGRVPADTFTIPPVMTELSEAYRAAGLIRTLDSGRIDDAKYLLRLRLDGHVLAIEGMLGSSDVRSRESARKLFSWLAQYRAENPSVYTGYLAQTNADFDARIESILKRANEGQK